MRVSLLYTVLVVIHCGVGDEVNEIDGLISVKHTIDLGRVRRHVTMWAKDLMLREVMGEKLVWLHLAHHANEVNVLANALLGHAGLDSAAVGFVDAMKDATMGDANGLRREKRNILGDIIHAVTGLATDARVDEQAKLDEEVRGKVEQVLAHQLAYEEKMTEALAELQAEEDVVQRRLSEMQRVSERGMRAISRLFAYQAMIMEDEETLEDALDAMRNGHASVRLDAYLGQKCGLAGLPGFEYRGVELFNGNVVMTYLGRVYQRASFLALGRGNETWRGRTGDREYLFLARVQSVPRYLTEQEVRWRGAQDGGQDAVLGHLGAGQYYVVSGGVLSCTLSKGGAETLTLEKGSRIDAQGYAGCKNNAIAFGAEGVRLRSFAVTTSGEDVGTVLVRGLYNVSNIAPLPDMKSRHAAIQADLQHEVEGVRAGVAGLHVRGVEEQWRRAVQDSVSGVVLGVTCVATLSLVGLLLLRVMRERRRAREIAVGSPSA